jgi:hypothetical protein
MTAGAGSRERARARKGESERERERERERRAYSHTHTHTQEMCFNAFARLANPKEPAEAYEEKVIARVRETVVRLRYANEVMPDVKDDIQGLL